MVRGFPFVGGILCKQRFVFQPLRQEAILGFGQRLRKWFFALTLVVQRFNRGPFL